ncbi:MAG: glycosyltransferase [Vitreimonas sp.]
MNPKIAPSASATRIVYLAADVTCHTVNLRVTSFIRAGAVVDAFTFRRNKFNAQFQPSWPNTHLGDMRDAAYLTRLPALFKAWLILLRHRAVLRRADVIYARLFDSAVLGLLAKWATGSRARMVYEIEDIQRIFFKQTPAGAIFRWLEQRLLKRIDHLVVLSPGFLRGYYEPVQNYCGASSVLENKIQLPSPPPALTSAAHRWRERRDKWVIGWNGTLRCERSIELLSTIAERFPDRVEIRTRGYPTETGMKRFMDVVSRLPNWMHGGEYRIPDDLEAIYGAVHFSWCFDFHDPLGNSPLLLACRMYQGGYYGAVPLVSAGSEMERFLAPHGIGHAFAEPLADRICAFLQSGTWENYVAERERVLSYAPTLFLETGGDTRRLLHTLRRSNLAPELARRSAFTR